MPLQPIHRALAVALALVALLALPASAAPATAADAYATQLRMAGRELTASLGLLGAVVGISIQYPVTPDAGRRASTKLAAAETKLRHVATGLAAMRPPAAVRADHARLRKAVIALADQVAPVLARVRAGYLVAAAKLPNLPAARSVGAALAALRKHGYRVG